MAYKPYKACFHGSIVNTKLWGGNKNGRTIGSKKQN